MLWASQNPQKRIWKGIVCRKLSLRITSPPIFRIKIERYLLGVLRKVSVHLNVARLVNIKLTFADRLFNSLIILIEKSKIRYLDLGKALLFSRNLFICLENQKFWRAPTTIELNISCWNFANVFYLTIFTKGCSVFFFFLRS